MNLDNIILYDFNINKLVCLFVCLLVHASTPVSGSMSSPALPAVTPITVKYERMRSELSATKKMMHQTLVTAQEVGIIKRGPLEKEIKNDWKLQFIVSQVICAFAH